MRIDLGRVAKQCEPTGEFANTESANSEDRLAQDLEGGKGKKPWWCLLLHAIAERHTECSKQSTSQQHLGTSLMLINLNPAGCWAPSNHLEI